MVIWTLLRIVHLLSMIWGVSGATVATILLFKVKKNPSIAKAFMRLAQSTFNLIWIGLILLILSGIGLSIIGGYIKSLPSFYILKLAMVVSIVSTWLLFEFVAAPKLGKLAPKSEEKPSSEFLTLNMKTRLLTLINLSCWYVVIVMSAFMTA